MQLNEMSDEQLDFWGEVFTQCRMRGTVSFRKFLENPWIHLQAVGLEDAPRSIRKGFSPLLPEQVDVVRRIRNKYGIGTQEEIDLLQSHVEEKEDVCLGTVH